MYISSDSLFSKILKKPSIVQKKNDTSYENQGFFHWIKTKQYFFFEKKNSNWPTKKYLIFQLRQFSIFFLEILWIGPWNIRIDWRHRHWCGSTYIVVRLSDISSKTGKKCIFGVFRLLLSLCRIASQSLMTSEDFRRSLPYNVLFSGVILDLPTSYLYSKIGHY